MAAQPLETLTAMALVTAATAAPSMHNAQPWRFRFHTATGTFEVRADPERSMPRTDPDGRALHLGCGAALFNLRVAAAHSGLHTRTKVLPDPADPELLATVRLDDTTAPDQGLAALFAAVHERHTSRQPFSEKEIPADVQELLREAARQEGAQLLFAEAWHAETVLGLVQDAEGRDTLDPERFEDIRRWTRPGSGFEEIDPSGDGIPEYAFGPRKRSGKAPVRDFAGRSPAAGRGSDAFENIPHLALLGTREDRPANWLRAGQAMQRVLLLATRQGLATSLTSHALEWPDLRQLVRDPLSTMGHVHMVLRLGHGPAGPTTPRRPVHEVLDVD
ncbi:nitroreductase family protein [Streptomyces sp. TRM66268-LWL]|uniref:Nitroreductase family protein n=1 Tax=Streptomyces polyasparticus TaxID=2767826 RepID=A0ABR7SSX0_9ACTN|nr:nitroreductase family protein [Streptomyces polyasparticus]MBC9717383.1 nitroreductase family protein [Streptomyces polyasparticus]